MGGMYSPRCLLALTSWVVALLWSHAAAALAALLTWRRRVAVPALSFASDGRDAVLVTGASCGLGLAVASALASRGAHVLLTSPSATRGEAAAAALRRAGGCASALVLRQRSAAGVAAFAAALDHALAPPAGGLRLRAAVLNAATFATTPRGHCEGAGDEAPGAQSHSLLGEGPALHASLAVNHLGSWRVARVVAPRLAAGGRVVVVGSFTHRCVTVRALLAWLRRPGCVGGPQPHPAAAYARSKAALAAAAAAEHAGGAACFVVADPGLVATRLTRAWPAPLAALARLAGAATRRRAPPDAAAAVVLAALAVPLDEARAARPPLYLFGRSAARLRPAAAGGGDAQAAREVLAATRELDAWAD